MNFSTKWKIYVLVHILFHFIQFNLNSDPRHTNAYSKSLLCQTIVIISYFLKLAKLQFGHSSTFFIFKIFQIDFHIHI